jgi:hypothetical protein
MKILTLSLLLGLTIPTNGQVLAREPINQATVPVKIYKKFISTEAKANKVVWYKVGGLSYEVNYSKEDIQLINLYNVLDDSVKQKQIVEYDVLPDDIKETLKDDFLKDIKINQIFKLLNNDKSRFEFFGTKGDERIEFRL